MAAWRSEWGLMWRGILATFTMRATMRYTSRRSTGLPETGRNTSGPLGVVLDPNGCLRGPQGVDPGQVGQCPVVDADGLGDLEEPDQLESIQALGPRLITVDLGEPWGARLTRGQAAKDPIGDGHSRPILRQVRSGDGWLDRVLRGGAPESAHRDPRRHGPLAATLAW